METTSEEHTHRRAIEQEKTVYRESFERLRVLKPEIEHIRKVGGSISLIYPTLTHCCPRQILEKSRATLQSQFDSWYNSLHARDGQILSQQQSSGNQNRSAYQLSSSAEIDEKYQSSERNSKRDVNLVRSVDSAKDSSRGSSRRDHSATEERKKKIGLHVTDSDGEDEEVNEDIMAFYKAKEELLKRRGG